MNLVVNRIDQLFAQTGRTRLIPFLTAGDPSLGLTGKLVHALAEAGADLIELGIPYSDPLADGPVIQRASQRALATGVALPQVLDLVRDLRSSGIRIPLVLFSYVNPLLQYGFGRFFAEAAEAGADGVVIPDLPVEENGDALEAAQSAGMHLISLVAPTSQVRIARIASQASGFLYCVSSLGVTGVRSAFHDDLLPFLEQVREHAKAPLAVGFGISTPEQVKFLKPHVDGVIVGSAIVREIEANLPLLLNPETEEEGIGKVKRFVQNLSGALQ